MISLLFGVTTMLSLGGGIPIDTPVSPTPEPRGLLLEHQGLFLTDELTDIASSWESW